MIDLITFIVGFILSIGFAIGLEILLEEKGKEIINRQKHAAKLTGVYILFFIGALLIGDPLFNLIPQKMFAGFLIGYCFGIINLFQRFLN